MGEDLPDGQDLRVAKVWPLGVEVTRRRFLARSAVVGGAFAGRRFLFGGLETLAPAARRGAAAGTEDVVATTCWIGKQECGILARRIDGRVVKFDATPTTRLGTLCPKGQGQITTLYDPNRVTTPLVRTNGKGVPGTWRRATWDEAIGLVAEQLNAAVAKDPLLAGFEIVESAPQRLLSRFSRSSTSLLHRGAQVGLEGSLRGTR